MQRIFNTGAFHPIINQNDQCYDVTLIEVTFREQSVHKGRSLMGRQVKSLAQERFNQPRTKSECKAYIGKLRRMVEHPSLQ